MPALWGFLFTTSVQKNKLGRKYKAFTNPISDIRRFGIHRGGPLMKKGAITPK